MDCTNMDIGHYLPRKMDILIALDHLRFYIGVRYMLDLSDIIPSFAKYLSADQMRI